MTTRSSQLALCLAVLALFGVAGCQPQNEYQPPPPPTVSVAQPVTQDVTEYIEFTGTTEATARVDIRARVMGYLQSIHFEDGADVEKGQLLFVIEPAPFEAELDVAQANLQKAEAALKLAEAEVSRTTPLVKRGALPQQELDTAIAERDTADANVAAAEAAITQAELSLSYTQVKSPISGRIGRHMVDIGNLVQAQSTLLTTVESYEPIYAYFSVSESDLLRFMERQRARQGSGQTAEAPVLFMGLSNQGGYPYEGRLDFLSLGVDPATGTAQRRGVFENADRSLVPGLFVRLRAPLGEPKPRLLVSERAISADQRGQFLLVVNDKNTVEYRPVKLGTAIEGLRVIESGVQAGDWVVVNGLQRARPNAIVAPQRDGKMIEDNQAKSEPIAASPSPKAGG